MYMGQELIWSREPSESSTFTLSLRDDVVATLSWENWSSAIAIVGTKSWSFNQTGIWRPQYAVIEGFLDTPVAFFKHQLRGQHPVRLKFQLLPNHDPSQLHKAGNIGGVTPLLMITVFP